MPNKKPQHYLRAHRKGAGLSQSEVGYLLGWQSGAKVSKFERFVWQPSLPVACAYQVMFNTPVSELFDGIFQEAQRRTVQRARIMLLSLDRAKLDRVTLRKIRTLQEIIVASETIPDQNRWPLNHTD